MSNETTITHMNPPAMPGAVLLETTVRETTVSGSSTSGLTPSNPRKSIMKINTAVHDRALIAPLPRSSPINGRRVTLCDPHEGDLELHEGDLSSPDGTPSPNPASKEQPSRGSLRRPRRVTAETPTALQQAAKKIGVNLPGKLTVEVPEEAVELQRVASQAWSAARTPSHGRSRAQSLRDLAQNPAVAQLLGNPDAIRILQAVANDPRAADRLNAVIANPQAALDAVKADPGIVITEVSRIARSASRASLSPQEAAKVVKMRDKLIAWGEKQIEELENNGNYIGAAITRFGIEFLKIILDLGNITLAGLTIVGSIFVGIVSVILYPFAACLTLDSEVENIMRSCWKIFKEAIGDVWKDIKHIIADSLKFLLRAIIASVYLGIAFPIGVAIATLSLLPLLVFAITSPLLCCECSSFIPENIWKATQKTAQLGLKVIYAGPNMLYKKGLELIMKRVTEELVGKVHITPESLHERQVERYEVSRASTP